MDFTAGFFDRLFGARITIEVPGPDGKPVKREVTQKWFDKMVAEKRIVEQQPTVAAHILDPKKGYLVEAWVIGKHVTPELVQEHGNRAKNSIYVLRCINDRADNTIKSYIVRQDRWAKTKREMESADAANVLVSPNLRDRSMFFVSYQWPAKESPKETKKETMTEKNAGTAFLLQISKQIGDKWPAVARQINGTLNTHLPDTEASSMEVTLAVISLQLGAVPNLFPSDQAKRLMDCTHGIISRLQKDLGYLQIILAYDELFDDAIRRGQSPLDAMSVYLLSERLGSRDTIRVGNSAVPDPLLVTAVGGALTQLGGAWWKNLLTKVQVVP